jgi:hypothetical protein
VRSTRSLIPFPATLALPIRSLVPHTHQQNGVAERKHCQLMEMGLDLLAHGSMPLKYWDEAFLDATYLINRTPTNGLSYDTPLHKLLGATPDYSSFYVFGCACCPICTRIIPINYNSIPPAVSSLITVICKRASSA